MNSANFIPRAKFVFADRMSEVGKKFGEDFTSDGKELSWLMGLRKYWMDDYRMKDDLGYVCNRMFIQGGL